MYVYKRGTEGYLLASPKICVNIQRLNTDVLDMCGDSLKSHLVPNCTSVVQELYTNMASHSYNGIEDYTIPGLKATRFFPSSIA